MSKDFGIYPNAQSQSLPVNTVPTHLTTKQSRSKKQHMRMDSFDYKKACISVGR
jgi:hypothetical protein